jgi:hypothetical protein
MIKLFSLLLVASGVVLGEEYTSNKVVPVIATKVGPYANPSETYPFYSLPFCAPAKVQREAHGLGEVLAGDHKVKTTYLVNFRVDVPWAS